MIIATHSGRFHADDAWAVMVLDKVFPENDLLRTRDLALIERADFAVDVGGAWDPQRGRFDHHQKEFDIARPSGVAYASAGLVWREFGARCVALLAQELLQQALSPEQAAQIAAAIDSDLVQYLDMADTGAARNAPGSYGLSALVSGFNPTWLDEARMAADGAENIEQLRLAQFRRVMAMLGDVLENAVRFRVSGMLAHERVRCARQLEDGRLLYLENGALPWSYVVRTEMPRVLFVIGYDRNEDRYILHTVPAAADSFVARKDLPASWSGLQGEQLARVTGVADAGFCHRNLFIASAGSWDGVLRMARQAIDS